MSASVPQSPPVQSTPSLRDDARHTFRGLLTNRGRFVAIGLTITILVSLALLVARVTPARPRPVVPLDFVRTDCDFILHARFADIWNSALIQDFYRRLPEHIRRQSEDTVSRVGVGMEFVESVTITLTNPEQPSLCAVVKTNRNYGSDDGKKILSSTAQAATVKWESRMHRGLHYDVGYGHAAGTPDTPLAIYAASESLFVMGNESGVKSALDNYLDLRSSKSAHVAPKSSEVSLEWVRPWISNSEYFFVGAGARTTNVNQVFAALDDPRTPDDVRQRLRATPGIEGLLLNIRPGQAVPAELKTLLSVESALIAMKLDQEKILHIQGRSHFPSVAEAEDAKNLLSGLLSTLRLIPEGTAVLPKGNPQVEVSQALSAFMRGIKVETDDRFVSFSARQDLAALVQNMPQGIDWSVNMHRLDMTSAPNLKQLANAMELYHAEYGHYPPAVVMDEAGTQPLYSWRVAILPYLGSEALKLHKEFHKQEPWDSPHNLGLSQKMPAVFEHPLARINNQNTAQFQGVIQGVTPYQLPVGNEAAFYGSRKVSKRELVDGLDRTIMIIETNPLVPWTAPSDLSVVAGDRVREILKTQSLVPGAPIETVLFDQTSRQFDRSISPDEFWGMINPKDGRGVLPKIP